MGVSGLGTGSFHPQSIAILSSAYRERRAFALGIHDSAANLGEVIAPLTIGALLWALRPVIFAAAMELAPPDLAGTTVGFLYSGNMGLSFVAPLSAGLIADAYGLPTAVTYIGIFPLLASVVPLGFLRSRAVNAV
jgi:MFS family permease